MVFATPYLNDLQHPLPVFDFFGGFTEASSLPAWFSKAANSAYFIFLITYLLYRKLARLLTWLSNFPYLIIFWTVQSLGLDNMVQRNAAAQPWIQFMKEILNILLTTNRPLAIAFRLGIAFPILLSRNTNNPFEVNSHVSSIPKLTVSTK